LLGMLCVALEPNTESGDNSPSASQAVALAVLVLALWAARQLARRDIPAARLRRWLLPTLAGGVLSLVGAGFAPHASPAALPAAWLGAAVCALLAGWAWRLLPAAGFWLPARVPQQVPPAQRLMPKADWRTFGTVLAFMALWVGLLQWLAPGLMQQ
jgi:hypothetical protein